MPQGARRWAPESCSTPECQPHYGVKPSWCLPLPAGACLLAATALDTDFLSLIKAKHVGYRVRRYKALPVPWIHGSMDPDVAASFNWPLASAWGRCPSIHRSHGCGTRLIAGTQSLWFVWHAHGTTFSSSWSSLSSFWPLQGVGAEHRAQLHLLKLSAV